MRRVRLPAIVPLLAIVAAAATWWPRSAVSAASATLPQVRLTKTVPITLPGESDSNSPVFWDLVDGTHVLHVLISSQRPSISTGSTLWDLGAPEPVRCTRDDHGGRWMEAAVLQDADGTLYGYYHEEPADVCGGAGDFSVILDRRGVDVYFFFSVYASDPSQQGVSVARMLWADRDRPQGRVDVWDGGIWRPAASTSRALPQLAETAPLFAASLSWHDASGRVDAFWGPSVHWNTYLEQYVMLLNRSIDASWKQEGIYVSFSPVLDDPSRWTTPYKVMNSGSWYPQVMGLEPGTGTDKLAGQTARLFVQGRSEHFITFERVR